MPPNIVVVIREDPLETPRAVEALRIALGLGTGPNPMTVILLDNAPLLLSEEGDDIADRDILEKHLPVFKELRTVFIVPEGAIKRFSLDPEFEIRESTVEDMAVLTSRADHVLVF